jgi:hypothetical protein
MRPRVARIDRNSFKSYKDCRANMTVRARAYIQGVSAVA